MLVHITNIASYIMYVYRYFYICIIYVHTAVEQHPQDTTTCQGDNATFTCVVFQRTGGAISPSWSRNGEPVNMSRHTVDSNATFGAITPLYIGSTVTVYDVTVFDNAALYRCDLAGFLSSNNATLNVVGKHTICTHVRMSLCNVFNAYCMILSTKQGLAGIHTYMVSIFSYLRTHLTELKII